MPCHGAARASARLLPLWFAAAGERRLQGSRPWPRLSQSSMSRAAWPGVAALMTGVQIVRGLLPDELDLTILLALAFIPARYSGAAPRASGRLSHRRNLVRDLHGGACGLGAPCGERAVDARLRQRRGAAHGRSQVLCCSRCCAALPARSPTLPSTMATWRPWSGLRRRFQVRWPARSDSSSGRSGLPGEDCRISRRAAR